MDYQQVLMAYPLFSTCNDNEILAWDNGTSSWVCSTVSGLGSITQAYQTVQEEGSPLTQRSTLNFVGAGFTATDNLG